MTEPVPRSTFSTTPTPPFSNQKPVMFIFQSCCDDSFILLIDGLGNN